MTYLTVRFSLHPGSAGRRRALGGLAATIAIAGVLLTSATAPALAAPLARRPAPICRSASHPELAAHISAKVSAVLAQRRSSVVGLAADDDALGLTCRLHQGWHFYAASVVKVTILSALLLKEGGPAHLTRAQRNLAYLMITQSNNNAATALWNEVGLGGMRRFLYRARMPDTILSYAWGLTEVTAADELTLLHLLTSRGTVLSPASRGYVLRLMSEVIGSQRWGVPVGAPGDVTVHVKNGWLPYPRGGDWHINSIGAFTGRAISYQIVILTGPPASGGQGEGYGIETIEDAARIINLSIAALR